MALALMAGACTNSSGSGDALDETTSTTQSGTSRTEPEPARPRVELSSSLAFRAPDPDPTPLPMDPDVRTGTLENGLTYYVRSNQAPGDRLELRLVVNAGSAQQDQPDSGLAHFVEHMLFNGTEKYPDNTLDGALQRLGLQFGADLNAYTSSDETVFILSSTTEPASVTEAFDVLYQWATAATLSDQAVAEERGVVREERRVRAESGIAQSSVLFDAIYDAGSEYEGYGTIGTTSGILGTTAEDTRRFYDRWYRPDLMAVVAVGDLTLDELEAEVTARFGAVTDRGDGQARTQPATVAIDERVVDLYLHPEMTAPRISLDYWVPTWDSDTVGGERLQLMDALMARVISSRLEEGIELGNVRALEPSVGMFAHNRGSQFLGFNFGGEDLEAATEDVLATMSALETFGVTEEELARATDAFQTWFTQYAVQTDTRQDYEFAGEYVEHYLTGASASSVSDWVARMSATLQDLTAEELTNHYRYVMSVSAPLLVGMGPDAESMPSIEELTEAIQAGLGASATALVEIEEIDELMVVPTIEDQGTSLTTEELGAKVWHFDNGTTGVFLQTGVSEGTISMSAQSGGGWSLLEDQDRPFSSLVTDAIASSGLNGFDKVQIDRYLSDQFVWVEPYIAASHEGFQGGAASGDEETMFQLLHLLVTQPQVDDVAFRSAVESGRIAAEQVEVSPYLQSHIVMQTERVGDETKIARPPTTEEISNLTAEQVLDIYQQRLGQVDGLVVVVVGDISVSSARTMMQTYVGTLPVGQVDPDHGAYAAPPVGVVELDVTAGSDRAGAGVDILFSSEQAIDDTVQLHTEVIQIIVQNRLTATIREELGATYSPAVSISSSAFTGSIEALIRVDGDPDRLEEIESAILSAVQDLAINGPTQDEFERAILVLESDYQLVSNEQYLSMLMAVATDEQPDAFSRWDGHLGLSAMTRAQAAQLSASMFSTTSWIRVARSE